MLRLLAPTSISCTTIRKLSQLDLQISRQQFALEITRKADVSDARIVEAFRRVERERFLSEGPWCIGEDGELSASSKPEFVYQDNVIAISPKQGITNGLPSLHARCLSALAPAEGERVFQVGAGTGYYTAVLAELVGLTGHVHAYEIDGALVEQAKTNLQPWSNVHVSSESGVTATLESADVIYVNAGVSSPPRHWFDALTIGGRLVLPLVSGSSVGAMWLIVRVPAGFEATFLCPARFYPCIGAQAEDVRLSTAYIEGDPQKVKSLRFDEPQNSSCWYGGNGWWLSTLSVAD